MLAGAAFPVIAPSGLRAAPNETPVLSSDGRLVGLLRSAPSRAFGKDRLLVRVRRSRGALFQRIYEDVIINVPQEKLRRKEGRIVLSATAQELRTGLYYDARDDLPPRVTLAR